MLVLAAIYYNLTVERNEFFVIIFIAVRMMPRGRAITMNFKLHGQGRFDDDIWTELFFFYKNQ
jgi:hypothetical protein